jgi:hypothetical protein
MDERRFRFDLFIALCALLVSTVAAGASAYQTYVINQQYQASIWPYLGFVASTSEGQASIQLKNYGLGPALVRTFEVLQDGKPQRSFNEIIDPLEIPSLKKPASVSVTTLHRGSVIPAGATETLAAVSNAVLVGRLLAHQSKIDVEICYCSLLGRCWMKRLQDPGDQPVDVRECPLPPIAGPRMFQR